jgi:hypothetical protein
MLPACSGLFTVPANKISLVTAVLVVAAFLNKLRENALSAVAWYFYDEVSTRVIPVVFFGLTVLFFCRSNNKN